MIFVCTGSRGYQFNRLIKEIDDLVGNGDVKEDIFAQIGDSTYLPKNFQYVDFLDSTSFTEYMDNARLIIAHGGTGVIVNALKKGKYVIGVPRLAAYGESLDDHQKQIVEIFENENYIKAVYDVNFLGEAINYFNGDITVKEYLRDSKIIDIIDEYISSL